MIRSAKVFVALLLALVCGGLVACAQPLAADRAAYVGDWVSPEMKLHIGQDGLVAYVRRNGTNTTTINAPIKRFEGDNFVVGVLFVSTTFVVTRAPYRIAGHWKMVVDGVEMTRVEADESATQTSI